MRPQESRDVKIALIECGLFALNHLYAQSDIEDADVVEMAGLAHRMQGHRLRI